MQENHYLVPEQQQGHRKDIDHHIASETTEAAEYDFVDAKDRMLDVNKWNKYCPGMSVEFRLTDKHGFGVAHHARKGDLVRIDKPGLGAERLDGFDWLLIEAIEYDDYPDLAMETFAIRLKTTKDPQHKPEGLIAAHDATFTFVIERRAAKLYVSYHARNHHSDHLKVTDGEWKNLIKSFADTSAT